LELRICLIGILNVDPAMVNLTYLYWPIHARPFPYHPLMPY